MAPQRRKKIAIIGSGCSGLGAAWALSDCDYDVHLFEKQSRLGGHTNTQMFRHKKQTVPVDTGFIVMNTATYPNFIRFLNHVGVRTKETEMTFGVSRDHGRFEWSGEAQGVFAQRRNFFRARHWRMLFDIVRFNLFALDLLADDDKDPSGKQSEHMMSIGEYLDRHGYSQAFRDDYLIPMTAAVWSTSPDKASLEFPAQTLVRFMWNHHLLSTLAARPAWLTIPGGSQKYIDTIVGSFKSSQLFLHLSCTVANVLRPQRHGEGGVHVSWINGQNGPINSDVFDHVIFACHGDQVLPLLSKHGEKPSKAILDRSNLSPPPKNLRAAETPSRKTSNMNYVSDAEIEIFSSFQTTSNTCYLHSDLSLMPTRRKCWTSWNYLINSQPSARSHPAGVSLTYCMNILQHIPEDIYGPVLVTMNPDKKPARALLQGEFTYRHPLYTVASVRAQARLEKLQNSRGVSYAGAWTKYGFHEDGFSSGLRVAVQHLGVSLPFDFVDSTYSRGHRPHIGWRDHLLRLFLLLMLIGINFTSRICALPGVSTVVFAVSTGLGALLDLADYAGFLDVI